MAYRFASDKAQCCSEGGGQHWTISDTAGNLDAVTSFDLVIVGGGQLIGVALGDYDTDQDRVVIDVTGCYELPVVAHNNAETGVAIGVGDWLYVDDADSEINRDFIDGIAFGQAMEAVDSDDEATICVKLWPVPYVDILAAIAAAVE